MFVKDIKNLLCFQQNITKCLFSLSTEQIYLYNQFSELITILIIPNVYLIVSDKIVSHF